MHQAVETLSGGQRQGVAVAARSAAFARNVIMDEPTPALGVKESGMVLDFIRTGRRAAVVNPKDYSMSDVVAIMTGAMEARGEDGDPAPA